MLNFRNNPLAVSVLNLALLIGLPSVGVSTTWATTHATTTHATTVATDFSGLVEQVVPSIVRVNVTTKISPEEIAKNQMELLLRRYFGASIPDSLPPAIESSFGTAFFVSNDGYMLTNHHVVAGADKITVTLNDRRELDAKVIGSDERTDVAVLKVEGVGFPALPIGNSDRLKVGEPVLAIGSPFGFDYSASAGIVSAKSRNFAKDTSVSFIQTDVALNPGNSGGPLFNQKGEVVGVNSRIFTGTGGYMGLSFSIPMDVAMDIYQQIRTTGKVSRAYLGVYLQDIDRNLADAYGLNRLIGALITRVLPNSPAQKAGLKAGDVILAFNGREVLSADDFNNLVSRAKPSNNFVLKVQRDNKIINLQGKLTFAPGDTNADALHKDSDDNPLRLGLRLRELNVGEQRFLRVKGVLITAVEPFGLASGADVQAGDVVIQFHNKRIETVADFRNVVQNLPKKGVVTLQIIRQGIPMIIGLRIE
ncbi:serine protease [Moraxella macacae 0408225]|uniref:Probable periplasmic serine endoprotease DegP-like n=1 Tax=Moraxella macacae 0408225 TaxID=1230338 RepID=L2F946_9GAMM|nr:Do family serine endopeptidase [Moraxella macacae]ELA09003.1 serine protease [Moraxella macacae 0408225]